MKLITLALADDHHLVRQGLKTLLEMEDDFRLVGEAGDGLEAIRIVERLKPDVLISDLMMPGITGLDVTQKIRENSPQTRVIILSMYANKAYVAEAMRRGAYGYVLKDSQASTLVTAVREVAAGRCYLSPPLSETDIEVYIKKAGTATLDIYETLTAREREVLKLVAEGHTSAEIAARLFISPRTAETHRANLMHKLGFRTPAELIRYALRRGIVTLDS